MNRIIILDKHGHKSPHYVFVRESGLAYSVVEEFPADWAPPAGASLVVTAQHYEQPVVHILMRLMEENTLPVLVLADGILEYRNTWLHPDSAPGAIFQPVFGHKIACMGRSQARVLESWGNIGKCEVVGAPRLDSLIGASPRTRKIGEPLRILVMTAKTPSFTPAQHEAILEGLRDLKDAFSARSDMRPVWRISGELENDLGLDTSTAEMATGALTDVLKTVDAMITTPSTAQLEGMLHDIPVVLLDYFNCPHYVPAAWTISARRHIEPTLSELKSPPGPRLLFQDFVLHDALECRTAAGPRMLQLVNEMSAAGRAASMSNEPLQLPPRMLPSADLPFHVPSTRFDLASLYPGHPHFANMDRVKLQIQIGHLSRRIDQLTTPSQSHRPLTRKAWDKVRRKFRKMFHRSAGMAAR